MNDTWLTVCLKYLLPLISDAHHTSIVESPSFYRPQNNCKGIITSFCTKYYILKAYLRCEFDEAWRTSYYLSGCSNARGLKTWVSRVYGFVFHQTPSCLKLPQIVFIPQGERVIINDTMKMLYLCVKHDHQPQFHIYKPHTLPSGYVLQTVLGPGFGKWLLINGTYRCKYVFNAKFIPLNREILVLNGYGYKREAFQECLYLL